MTTRKGRRQKTGQRHQNNLAFDPGRHGQSRVVKQAAGLTLGGLCARCKEKLEWKRKYDKYKPLSAPKKCILCQGKQVKLAYYQICQNCAEENEVCAKCGLKESVVECFQADRSLTVKEENEFRVGLKQMREREKRTLLRQSKGQSASARIISNGSNTDKGLVVISDHRDNLDEYPDKGPVVISSHRDNLDKGLVAISNHTDTVDNNTSMDDSAELASDNCSSGPDSPATGPLQ